MKKIFLVTVLFFAVFICKAQDKSHPLIKNYGLVFDVPFAIEKPDTRMEYKILVDITTAPAKPDSLNDALDAVARMMNLHVAGGVNPKKLHVVIVVHNAAAFSFLNNEAYQQKYHIDNPNAALITALHDAGVKIFLCGQTMMKRNIEQKALMPEVVPALSALTTLTTYQLKGYALMKF
jgi:intracellular sulfur oxidation DsrE/DsrF family protein